MRRYRLLLALLAPALVLYTAWQALRHRDARYLRERLGFGRGTGAPGAIWVHAASVGEVNAVAPLVRRLAVHHAPRPVVVSTVTPSGAAVVRRRLADCAAHRYLPLDWPWAARRMVRTLRPACLLVAETELWPSLYRECERAGVPIVLVNGRLSARSLHLSAWWRGLLRHTLAPVRAVLARSAADAEAFIALGAEFARVRTVGNLKYALDGEPPVPIGLPRAYVLAASTREGEERAIVEQWRAVRHGGRLLVLAPRHPRRLGEILAALAPFKMRLAVRSRDEAIDADTEIYIADTLGELGAFMAGAELVIMGGSFAPCGGHNLLEAARLGKAVVFGPHMENFAEEAEWLRTHEAAIQLGAIEQLADCLSELLAQPAQRAAMGERGARAVAERAGVLEDYLAALAELCPELAPASSPS